MTLKEDAGTADRPSSLRILIAASEVIPFAKTGGLADVAGALPKALAALGHDVAVVLPRYRRITQWDEIVGDFPVPMGDHVETAVLKRTTIGDDDDHAVDVYFIDNYRYFDREELYDYPDDARRFIFFSRAILEMLKYLDRTVDVIHCNDWQTGLVPVFLDHHYSDDPFYSGIATAFTIHNLQYQGAFHRDYLKYTGLPETYYHWQRLEFYNQFSLMKGGLLYADVLNTVSEAYAEEIQTEEYGYRLDGILRDRNDELFGIVNGIDYTVWNPRTDIHIDENYDPETLERKKENKKALQADCGLDEDEDAMLFGMVSRLSDQKGLDILVPALPEMLDEKSQMVLLGTGDQRYHEMLADIHKRYDNAAVLLKYDEVLAHRIYAAVDAFLMPSRFEPCGLSQLISLKYGTIPIVRATGGLSDTIDDHTADPDEGNGFVFEDYSGSALIGAFKRALAVYAEPEKWTELMERGMAQDFSWKNSARHYVDIYRHALAHPRTLE